MSDILFQPPEVNPTTWVYLSSLLTIGLFFKFSRFWSVRNLDIALLILLAPGLLLVEYGYQQKVRGAADSNVAQNADNQNADNQNADNQNADNQSPDNQSPDNQNADNQEPTVAGSQSLEEAAGAALEFRGYLWMLAISALWLIRVLVDSNLVRRPLLEPNLTTGGLTFIGCSLFVFLMANVINSQVDEEDLQGPADAQKLMNADPTQEAPNHLRFGPGNAVLHLLPTIPTVFQPRGDAATQDESKRQVAKAMAILSQFAVVIGIISISYWHFNNVKTGIGCATLYLMLPYTSQMTGDVYHVLPAALLVWMILGYRRPYWSGLFMGLAISTIYFPLYLLPLWISFYWQRGLMRFLAGTVGAVVVIVLSLIFRSETLIEFAGHLQSMLGIMSLRMNDLDGVWVDTGWNPVYRWPVVAAFIAMCGSLAIWPAQKNLGTLLSCSAAVMIATQFWHGNKGGLLLAWYLPLVLLTVFRPNLEDRIAVSVLGDSWFSRRKPAVPAVEQAA